VVANQMVLLAAGRVAVTLSPLVSVTWKLLAFVVAGAALKVTCASSS
jgi:hypothetical protein